MQFCSGPASWILTSDRERIRYIAVNLLQNACKYSPPASVIRVELQADDRAACLRVSDEGIGIPAAEIAELFSPFYRASNAGDRPGTGMGLAVVKESAQVVGAKIGIDSRADRGTTFTVTLARTPER
ncbi:MAG: sensor histidine kinase [Gammaproteobacteria bacterium]|nr:sensor histidine kinase [Gammaproteobacteria bacterium]